MIQPQYKPSKVPDGAVFDRLTVVGTARKKGWWTYYQCKCRCGRDAVVCGRELVYHKTRSCGCLQKETASKNSRRLPKGEAARNRLFSYYRWVASKRNLNWSLSSRQFSKITSSACHYCGQPPSAHFKTKETFGDYVYNGVDRKNNAVGYTPENSVPCCKQCNFAKRNLPYAEFKAWLGKAGAWQLRRAQATTTASA
jgi:hypothetical protein